MAGWLPHHHDIPSQGGEVRVQASESRRFTSLALTSHPFRQASSHILPLNSSFQNAHLTAQLQLQPPYPFPFFFRAQEVVQPLTTVSPRYKGTSTKVQRKRRQPSSDPVCFRYQVQLKSQSSQNIVPHSRAFSQTTSQGFIVKTQGTPYKTSKCIPSSSNPPPFTYKFLDLV